MPCNVTDFWPIRGREIISDRQTNRQKINILSGPALQAAPAKMSRNVKKSKRGINTENQKSIIPNVDCFEMREEVQVFTYFPNLNDWSMALIWWYMGEILVRYRQDLVHVWLKYDWYHPKVSVIYIFTYCFSKGHRGFNHLKLSLISNFPQFWSRSGLKIVFKCVTWKFQIKF